MIENGKPVHLQASAVIPGSAQGQILFTNTPLSFWGGICAETGEIIDRRHESSGRIITGKIFAFPNGRGSSTSSAILLECIRIGTAPAAIINSQVDSAMALGSIVADELYGKSVPVFLLSEADFARLCDGDFVHIHPDGRIDISSQRKAPNGSQ
jgi:predicted aconitase with swiveling domain